MLGSTFVGMSHEAFALPPGSTAWQDQEIIHMMLSSHAVSTSVSNILVTGRATETLGDAAGRR